MKSWCLSRLDPQMKTVLWKRYLTYNYQTVEFIISKQIQILNQSFSTVWRSWLHRCSWILVTIYVATGNLSPYAALRRFMDAYGAHHFIIVG